MTSSPCDSTSIVPGVSMVKVNFFSSSPRGDLELVLRVGVDVDLVVDVGLLTTSLMSWPVEP